MVLSVSFGFYISRLLLNDEPLNPPSPYHPSLRPSDANFNCSKLAQLCPTLSILSVTVDYLTAYNDWSTLGSLSRVPSLSRSIHSLIYRLFYTVLLKIEIKKTIFIIIIEKKSFGLWNWMILCVIKYLTVDLWIVQSMREDSCHYTWHRSVIRCKCKRHGVVVVGGGCWRRRPLVIDAHPWEPICRGVLSLSSLFILWSITASSWRRDILSQTRRRSVWPLHCYYSSSETGLFFFIVRGFLTNIYRGECRMGVAECR